MVGRGSWSGKGVLVEVVAAFVGGFGVAFFVVLVVGEGWWVRGAFEMVVEVDTFSFEGEDGGDCNERIKDYGDLGMCES